MRLEDYTPDNVCRAMGLSSFESDEMLRREDDALRIVFLPSFHPEVTVTFQRSGMDVSVAVNALEKMLWHEPIWALLPNVHSRALVKNPKFEELLTLFDGAAAASHKEKPGICIDGVGIAACRYRGLERCEFREHVYRNAVERFAKAAIQIACDANKDPVVANALAAVAKYLGLDFPTVELPPPPEVTRLLILGTPEARQEYFEMLAQAKAKRD